MANEKRLIDANALRKRMFSYYSCVDENSSKEYYKGETLMNYEVADMIEDCIDNAPTVDAVFRGVLDQVRWERDIAIGQLESYGVSLGEKADVVKAVHGHWVASGCGFDCCSECRKVYADGYLTAMGIKPRTQFNYCPNCGAKMDRERKEL